MVDWRDFENLLIVHRDNLISISRIVFLYEEKINCLIENIKKSSYDGSHLFFDNLFILQSELSTAKYKYNFCFSDKLCDFIYNFDRDDDASREYWYSEIQKGWSW